MIKKKAQGGVNAAILVAIRAGLIVLYIVFLPTSERQKLVGEGKSGSSSSGSSNPNVLLDVSPGLLSTARGVENEKTIPNIFLVETTNAKELEVVNPFIIRNGWFDKQEKSIDLRLDDSDNTANVVLSFTTKKRSGILTIKLNSNVIFESELTSDIIEPIKLNKNLLGKTNTITFTVSSVGFKFWTTNEYSFDNIKIIGDITDTSRQESTNIFTLSESEYSSMDKANLRYIPYCGNVNSLGPMDIFVNNKKLVSSIPQCDNAYSQSIPKSVLNQGENNIVFKTSKGSYSVEQIKISLDFKEPQVKTYYFEITTANFQKISSNSNDAVLTIKFVDNKKQKSARLDVNGHLDTIETTSMTFSKNINDKLSKGNNYVRIEPLGNFEVANLKIELD